MESHVLAIVPVHDGQDFASKAVQSLLSQNYPNLKILVIDDCSEDQSYQLILKEFSHFPQVAVERNEGNMGLAQTLNKALGFVTDEDFLLVLEQDCELLDSSYVRNALRHFNCDNVGVVSGENLPAEDEELSLVKKIFVHHLCEDVHDNGVAEVGFSLLKADVFRIDILKKVGGFESSAEWKFACEEHIISRKIRSSGHNIIKDSSLQFRAYWGRQETLWQNIRKEAVYGRGLGWALATMKSDLGIGKGEQLQSKRLARIIQMQYVLLTVFSMLLFVFSPLVSLTLLSLGTIVQLGYLIHRALTFNCIKEKALFVFTGFLRGWVYIPSLFFGFLYGSVMRSKEKILRVSREIS